MADAVVRVVFEPDSPPCPVGSPVETSIRIAAMNAAHLHLLTTHAPVMGTFFGLCLLLFALLQNSEELKRVALLVFVVAALLALPAYLSGESASDLLRKLMPGMTRDESDQHAEIAALALAGSLGLGVVSLVGLIRFRIDRKLAAGFLALVLLLAVMDCALLGWTANLGGKIRHLEIRSQTLVVPAPTLAAGGFPRSAHDSRSPPFPQGKILAAFAPQPPARQ